METDRKSIGSYHASPFTFFLNEDIFDLGGVGVDVNVDSSVPGSFEGQKSWILFDFPLLAQLFSFFFIHFDHCHSVLFAECCNAGLKLLANLVLLASAENNDESIVLENEIKLVYGGYGNDWHFEF
jgi:hypothetical protein